jgi:hypothetical protein
VLLDSPVGYWKLDEPSGLVAADSSPTGQAGAYENGPTLNVAPLINAGKAATFGGSTAVNIPWNAAFQTGAPANRITIEAWVKLASTASTPVIACQQTGSGGGDQFLFRCSAHHAEMTVWDSGDNATGYAGTAVIDDNLRHHVVGVYDGAKLITYVDGLADGAGTPLVVALETVSQPIQIGIRINNVGTRSQPFTGTIDEVALYKTALSPARIAAHYAAGIFIP